MPFRHIMCIFFNGTKSKGGVRTKYSLPALQMSMVGYPFYFSRTLLWTGKYHLLLKQHRQTRLRKKVRQIMTAGCPLN